MSNRKLNIELEYQQEKLENNIVILKKYLILLIVIYFGWFLYEVFVYYQDQDNPSIMIMILIYLILTIFCFTILVSLLAQCKKYYQIVQAILVVLFMSMLILQIYNHQDVILTRNPNPKKTLPFIIGVENLLSLMVLFNIMTSYYLQIISVFLNCSVMIGLLLIYENQHPRCWLNCGIIIFQTLLNSDLYKNNYQTIYKYLKRLEHNWKQIIDDLHEGIILFNKNFQILYENDSVQAIFGMDNRTYDKQISLKVHELQIFKLKSNQTILKLNSDRKLVFESYSQKEFKSLKNYLKWIFNHTKMKRQKRNHRFKKKYSIQSKITNNKKEQVLLEQILKVEQFAGQLVYSINIRINQDLIINEFKSQNQLRSLMVGAISHDLRTPLNGIKVNLDQGYATQNIDSNFLKETFLKPAMINCDILMTLVDQFINYTKEDFNQDIRMIYEKVDIQDIIEQMKAMFSMRAIMRKIDLIFQIDEQIPKVFITDPQKLRQILQNLIGNAMKFTFKGYIKVQAKQIQIQNKKAIHFRVIDTGYGIKKEDQKHLFQLFGLLDETKVLNKSGTGIGLHQSDKLARKLGFSNQEGINLESQLGKGSTFSFIIENKEGKEEIQEEKEEEKEEENEKEEEEEIKISNLRDDLSEKKNQIIINKTIIPRPMFCCPNILLVDDEAFNIQALKVMLKIRGYSSNYTFQGQLAIDMIKKQKNKSCQCKYKLVLMDCNMPILNGYDACKIIKYMILTKEINPIKIIAVTADVTELNKKQCKQAGFDDFITKPFKNSELDRILQINLKKQK